VKAFVVLVSLLMAQTAMADDQPWARGVSEERKAEAKRHLDAGNVFLLDNQYREALAEYERAIAVWDHPAIRFNMVRALIALDRTLEAAESLDKALAYGASPLDDVVYREALNYQRLIANQIATLEVVCTQANVKVSLDGATFLACPGSKSVRTTPGSHAVVGTGATLLTQTLDVVVLPGKGQRVEVTLQSLESATRTRTRWATWKPWAVVGGGVALAGVGLILEVLARGNRDAYYERLASPDCQPAGCAANDPILEDAESRMQLENRLAIGSLVAGGAVLATGVVLVVLNRSYAYIPDQNIRVTPTAGTSRAGVVVQLDF
jgi:tetratricopeptide (TPR) repeat protein